MSSDVMICSLGGIVKKLIPTLYLFKLIGLQLEIPILDSSIWDVILVCQCSRFRKQCCDTKIPDWKAELREAKSYLETDSTLL
ncbi:hypothetical protein Ocin01_16655 [Orchesella cincta]|uniref:Uncharacterized protein n=1 Tax=Orchesella cincta TaxID=48709 RepID=A0A1D2MAL4_ORCCI|nr:hypothetical protein Ocin01_16655 [Orchesella cincta]